MTQSDTSGYAQGGIVDRTDEEDLTEFLFSQPPAIVPPAGMCWRGPDGSREWIIPNSNAKPLQPYKLVP